MTTCPAYHLAADLRCGLAKDHDGKHVTAELSPTGGKRCLYRWRSRP